MMKAIILLISLLILNAVHLQFANYHVEIVYIFDGSDTLKVQVKFYPIAYSWQVFTGIFRSKEPTLRDVATQLVTCTYQPPSKVKKGYIDHKNRCAVFNCTATLFSYGESITLNLQSSEGCIEEPYLVTKTIFVIEAECYLIKSATPTPKKVTSKMSMWQGSPSCTIEVAMAEASIAVDYYKPEDYPTNPLQRPIELETGQKYMLVAKIINTGMVKAEYELKIMLPNAECKAIYYRPRYGKLSLEPGETGEFIVNITVGGEGIGAIISRIYVGECLVDEWSDRVTIKPRETETPPPTTSPPTTSPPTTPPPTTTLPPTPTTSPPTTSPPSEGARSVLLVGVAVALTVAAGIAVYWYRHRPTVEAPALEEDILQRLEERFVKGEISKETYLMLREKYERELNSRE